MGFVAAALGAAAGLSLRWDPAYLVRAPRHREVGPLPPGARAFRVEVGPPHAVLEGWIVDPARQPFATVLVLHGLRGGKAQMMEAATKLAEDGFRAVLLKRVGFAAIVDDVVILAVLSLVCFSGVLLLFQRRL